MDHWILDVMSRYGYLGLALLIMAENLFPPIPSEIILTFGGFMTTYTRMHIPGTVLSATVGSVGGALILYQAGRFLSPDRLDTLLSGKLGRILHLKKADIQKAADWFDSRGNYTVFFCRFIPIVRSLISIPAGMADMALGRFLWMTVAGSLLWNLILICAGAAAGTSWQKAVQYFGSYTQAAKIVLGVGALVGGVVLVRRYIGKKKRID